MFMIFQHLLFISSNVYHTNAHMQHQEYIIIYLICIYLQHINMSYKAQRTMFLVIKKLMSRYSDTLCMEIHLFKITKCFAHCIGSYICISNILLISCCAQILKVRSKIRFTLRNVDRAINKAGTMIQT